MGACTLSLPWLSNPGRAGTSRSPSPPPCNPSLWLRLSLYRSLWLLLLWSLSRFLSAHVSNADCSSCLLLPVPLPPPPSADIHPRSG